MGFAAGNGAPLGAEEVQHCLRGGGRQDLVLAGEHEPLALTTGRPTTSSVASPSFVEFGCHPYARR